MNCSDIIKLWKNYTGNYKVTLSGELLIKNIDSTQLLVLSDENRKVIEKCVSVLAMNLPFFQIEKVESMAETTIKIFAYNVYTSENAFLEKFRVILLECIEEILKCEIFTVSLSVFGTYQDTKEKVYFRYLNKKSYVEYKLTQKEELDFVESFLTRKMKVYIGVIMLVCVIAFFIYDLIILENSLELGNILDILPLVNSL
jgi:hypothetical protein